GIALTNPERCWIRRRWKRPQPVRDFNVPPEPDDALGAAIKANLKNPPGVVDALKDQLQIDPILNFLGWLTHSDKWERLQWYLDYEIEHIAQQHLAIGATVFEAILIVLYRIARDPVLDSRDEVAAKVSDIIGKNAFGRLIRGGKASGGKYANILDAHNYE